MSLEGQRDKNLPEDIDGMPMSAILRALKSIRYGDIRIVVQNYKVVQIDKTEKVRLS